MTNVALSITTEMRNAKSLIVPLIADTPICIRNEFPALQGCSHSSAGGTEIKSSVAQSPETDCVRNCCTLNTESLSGYKRHKSFTLVLFLRSQKLFVKLVTSAFINML